MHITTVLYHVSICVTASGQIGCQLSCLCYSLCKLNLRHVRYKYVICVTFIDYMPFAALLSFLLRHKWVPLILFHSVRFIGLMWVTPKAIRFYKLNSDGYYLVRLTCRLNLNAKFVIVFRWFFILTNILKDLNFFWRCLPIPCFISQKIVQFNTNLKKSCWQKVDVCNYRLNK